MAGPKKENTKKIFQPVSIRKNIENVGGKILIEKHDSTMLQET